MATPDRWPPWIETRVTSTANTAITAAGQVAVAGTSKAVTAHVATRVQVVATFRLVCTLFTAATGVVRGKLLVNGAQLNPEVSWIASAVNQQNTITGVWTVDQAKETTTTYELALDLGGTADNDYLSIGSHTGFVIVAMPNLHS